MVVNINQTPEQKARDNIDELLTQAGWLVQDKKKKMLGMPRHWLFIQHPQHISSWEN